MAAVVCGLSHSIFAITFFTVGVSVPILEKEAEVGGPAPRGVNGPTVAWRLSRLMPSPGYIRVAFQHMEFFPPNTSPDGCFYLLPVISIAVVLIISSSPLLALSLPLSHSALAPPPCFLSRLLFL